MPQALGVEPYRPPLGEGQAKRIFESAYDELMKGGNPQRISRFDPQFERERKEALRRMRENQELFAERLSEHLSDLQEGKLTRGQAEYRMKRDIREHYRAAFELGKRTSGNLYLLTHAEERWLKKLRYDEFRYLRGFLDDVEAGRGIMPYPKRLDMYAKAIREVGWMGWLIGNMSPKRRIAWHWAGGKEHCRTCAHLAVEGFGRPMPVKQFLKMVKRTGHLPQSGSLECLGYNCGCWLEEQFVGASRDFWEYSVRSGL